MPYKQNSLSIFQRDSVYKAPDTSEITLGPQKFYRKAKNNGPGSVAMATFFHGASTAVMCKEIFEQWFYIDGPRFYLWLCQEHKHPSEGKFYQVTPGTKIEIPPRTKFQLYNPSDEKVQVLMVTSPYWPQDETAKDTITYPVGAWKKTYLSEFHAKAISQDYLDSLYEDDEIAKAVSSGFEYIEKILLLIGEAVADYSIIGDTWFTFNGSCEYQNMPIHAGALVTPPLNNEKINEMKVAINYLEAKNHFNTGISFMWLGQRDKALKAFQEALKFTADNIKEKYQIDLMNKGQLKSGQTLFAHGPKKAKQPCQKVSSSTKKLNI